MNPFVSIGRLACLLATGAGWLLALPVLAAGRTHVEFDLQRRDPATGAIAITRERVESARVGVVVVDMWNFHWCKTSTERVAAMVPRMNAVLKAARSLGMQIFLCPTDVADNYVGTPAVEAMLAIEPLPVPVVRAIDCPPAADGGGCTCGKERCHVNYGWDGMHPELVIGPNDLMPNDPERLYAVCKAKGLTHLIYLGVHTQVCLLGKSVGLRNMSQAGFTCILARDLTDAHGRYDPAHGVTPDGFTAEVVAHFEKHLAPTINAVDFMRKNGQWADIWQVDPVRIAPWGTKARPHLFEEPLTVTLSIPWHTNANIHYTLDGSTPTVRSPLYSTPLRFATRTLLRAVAYEKGRAVGFPSEAYYVGLGPKPALPDVYLSDLKPWRAVGPGHSPSFQDHRFSPRVNPPQMDLTNHRQPLRLRDQRYQKGVGVHAPNQLVYELKPEYERFVALAGVDEYILDTNLGSNLAMHPSVVFKLFIDGKPMGSSPVMRIAEEPWRFDVKIPAGARRISLVAADAGNGNKEDFANWVNAGFVLKK
jgi:hypothetical protein